jgi:hypothetical protein
MSAYSRRGLALITGKVLVLSLMALLSLPGAAWGESRKSYSLFSGSVPWSAVSNTTIPGTAIVHVGIGTPRTLEFRDSHHPFLPEAGIFLNLSGGSTLSIGMAAGVGAHRRRHGQSSRPDAGANFFIGFSF